MQLSLISMDDASRASKALASSPIVPADFQNNPGACFTAILLAQDHGCNPLMIMQNMYSVHGRYGFSGAFCIAALNRCPKYKRIEYQYVNGTDWQAGIRVVGHRTDGELDYGTAITPAMVQAEGWGKNPKWKTMPEQMYKYRAAAFFTRAYCPELLMGYQTTDELADLHANGTYRPAPAAPAMRNVTPAPAELPTDQLAETLFYLPAEDETPQPAYRD